MAQMWDIKNPNDREMLSKLAAMETLTGTMQYGGQGLQEYDREELESYKEYLKLCKKKITEAIDEKISELEKRRS